MGDDFGRFLFQAFCRKVFLTVSKNNRKTIVSFNEGRIK